MYKYIESPYINLKKNFIVNKLSPHHCEQMEEDIFNFINLIRQKPSKLIPYIKNSQIKNNTDEYEINQLINYIHNLSTKKISFPPLLKKKELTKISNDLLYYIKSKINTQEKIKKDLLQNPEINLRIRASPYITIKGKYYEGIVLESNDLLEIISYILKDIKGRNVLFNEKIKYIGIACGYIENRNEIYNNKIISKICTIIDLVQDFEKNYEYRDNNRTKVLRNKYILPKSYSFDKTKKRKTRQKKYNNNLNKDNTYDNILFDKYNNNSPLSKIKEETKTKTPISSMISKIKSQKLFPNTKTPNNTDLNKIYNNNSFYCSKYEKKQKAKKELDDISESKDNSSVSFTKKKIKKKLKPEEKLELLRQINKESREKSKKKKQVIKIDDDSKSASFTTKKNDISNEASFSEIISVDYEKKPKININKLKSELKKELKNEVKEEIKAELENKIDINNNLKIPLLKLFLNQNVNDIGINGLNDYSFDIGTNNKIKRDTKGLENNYSNRSINSIDIFLPPNKNITAFDNDAIPGLININSKIINTNDNSNINNNKKENVIIKKFVKLNRIKNKGNKTPNNTLNRNYKLIPNISPSNNRKTNFIYHKIPFANNNIYCNNIKKKNNGFNTKNNFNNINSPNIINCFARSPRKSGVNSHLTFKKIIVKNINNNNKNNSPKGQKTTIDKIIKIPKKIINNLNYIDNNSIIINNKTNNIVYIKQTSPNRTKSYEINGVSKKK